MQLVLIIAVLLMLGSGGAHRPELSSEMTEILKYISDGNGEMDKILKEVEQVTELVNTFAPLINAVAGGNTPFDGNGSSSTSDDIKKQGCGDAPCVMLPLKPIANIADDGIYNALSKAIA